MTERINCIQEELDNISELFARLSKSFKQLSVYLEEELLLEDSEAFVAQCIDKYDEIYEGENTNA